MLEVDVECFTDWHYTKAECRRYSIVGAYTKALNRLGWTLSVLGSGRCCLSLVLLDQRSSQSKLRTYQNQNIHPPANNYNYPQARRLSEIAQRKNTTEHLSVCVCVCVGGWWVVGGGGEGGGVLTSNSCERLVAKAANWPAEPVVCEYS